MSQRPYLKDRLIEHKPEGYVVIVPIDAPPPTPFACPICHHVMRSRDDEQEYVQFGCCDRCSQLWARPRKDAWLRGWRPTSEQVESAELERMPLLVSFNTD